MEFGGRYHFAADRSAVWAALNDAALLKAVIPGCERMVWTSPTTLDLRVRVGLGPIRPAFSGELSLSAIHPAERYTLSGRGKGMVGFAQAAADIALTDAPEGGTVLRFTADGHADGGIMRLGRALIGNSAQHIIDGFFAAIGSKMGTIVTTLPPQLILTSCSKNGRRPLAARGKSRLYSNPMREVLSGGTAAYRADRETFMTNFKRHLGALAAGVAGVALLASAAMADPAVIYDLGGKFDKSFNEAAYDGAEQWKKETGGTYHDIEIQAEAQREQAVRKFAQAGYSPIVVTGFSFADTLTKVAPDFPNIHFIQIDSVVNAPNVESVVYKSQDASYLAGVLAAKTSKTGKVGFVGGMDIPLIHAFFCGYKEGFMATNAQGQVFENYTGTTATAWNDPTTAGELAKADFDKGADIVYAAAGGSGLGVIQAAKDGGKMSIGVDSNQNYLAPGSVLTSVLKRVDVTVYTAFKAGDAGFKGGTVLDLGVAEGGVGLAMDDNNKPLVTADAQAAVDAATKGIADGSIKVHDYQADNQCP